MVNARRTARRTACLSNLRQIGMCLEMFRQDLERVPAGDGSNRYSTVGRAVGLGELIPGYLGDSGVLFCPGSRITPQNGGVRMSRIRKEEGVCSYAYYAPGGDPHRAEIRDMTPDNHSGRYVNFGYVGGRVVTRDVVNNTNVTGGDW